MNKLKKPEFVSKLGEWKITTDGFLVNPNLYHYKCKDLYKLDLACMDCCQQEVQHVMMDTMFSLIAASDKAVPFTEWLQIMNKVFPTLCVENWQGKPSAFYIHNYVRKNFKYKRKPIKASLRFKILERDKFRCQACGASAANGADLHIDHILPVSRGGTNDESNLRVLCSECNIGRGNRYDT